MKGNENPKETETIHQTDGRKIKSVDIEGKRKRRFRKDRGQMLLRCQEKKEGNCPLEKKKRADHLE